MNNKLQLLLQALLVAHIGYAAESAKDISVATSSTKAPEAKYRSALYGTMRTVYGVPDLCVRLAEDLVKQPIFDGTGATPKVSKVLSVTDWNLCLIFDILNKNATKVLGIGKGKGWPAMFFGSGNYTLLTKDGQKIPQGLLLGIYKDLEPCHPMTLGATFEKLILTLATGWAAVNPHDLSGSIKRKDATEWNLLIKKKQALISENALIGLLAVHLELEKSASLHEKQEVFVEKDEALHWWIKKDSYDTILKAFQLSKTSE